MNNALIIFIKNPVLGKVKTRLAATIGNEKALEIYKSLVAHTMEAVKECNAAVFLYFSDSIEETISTQKPGCIKKIQSGKDLGERMLKAFDEVSGLLYQKVVIIGTDCPGINLQLIDEAFAALENSDVVIGPAADGGYYLLGMNKPYKSLFQNINWSTSAVLNETISRCDESELKYALLEVLHDLDEEKDLVHVKSINKLFSKWSAS